jgi:hypothetical protein
MLGRRTFLVVTCFLTLLSGCSFQVETVDERGWSISSRQAAVEACKDGMGQELVTTQPVFAQRACECSVTKLSAVWRRDEFTRRIKDPKEDSTVDSVLRTCKADASRSPSSIPPGSSD